MDNKQNKYFERVLNHLKYKVWCQKHPTGFIGVNKNTGNEWKKCSQGYRFGEECIIRHD